MNPTAVVKQPIDKTKSITTKYTWYVVALVMAYSAAVAIFTQSYHGNMAEKLVQFIQYFFYNIGICLTVIGKYMGTAGNWLIGMCK
jgi:hypothetical protein